MLNEVEKAKYYRQERFASNKKMPIGQIYSQEMKS
jgi:hypothetical protein